MSTSSLSFFIRIQQSTEVQFHQSPTWRIDVFICAYFQSSGEALPTVILPSPYPAWLMAFP